MRRREVTLSPPITLLKTWHLNIGTHNRKHDLLSLYMQQQNSCTQSFIIICLHTIHIFLHVHRKCVSGIHRLVCFMNSDFHAPSGICCLCNASFCLYVFREIYVHICEFKWLYECMLDIRMSLCDWFWIRDVNVIIYDWLWNRCVKLTVSLCQIEIRVSVYNCMWNRYLNMTVCETEIWMW